MQDTNLLRTPVFGVRYEDRKEDRLTFPGLLAVLAEARPVVLTACRPHQHDAFLAFCCQLAAFTLARQGVQKPPQDALWWVEALEAETTAWDLVTAPCEAAFMQVPIETMDPKKGLLKLTPDEADGLNPTKNHALKNRTVIEARAEHWVYSLIGLQTQTNTRDARHCAASRAPFGRMFVSLGSGHNLGARFCRGIRIWLRERPRLIRTMKFKARGGHALLWTIPWAQELWFTDLDPTYVDVCRIIRLIDDPVWGRVTARLFHPGLGGHRIENAKDSQTRKAFLITGDVTAPVRPKKGLMSPRKGGFTYKVLHEVLFESRCPALSPLPEDGNNPILFVSGIARSSGATEGFHTRTLHVPASVLADEASSVGGLSKDFLTIIKQVKERVLKPVINTLAEANDTKSINADLIYGPFETRVDAVFFDRLFAATDLPKAKRQWLEELLSIVTDVVEETLEYYPLPAFSRWMWLGQAMTALNRGKRHLQETLCPAFMHPQAP